MKIQLYYCNPLDNRTMYPNERGVATQDAYRNYCDGHLKVPLEVISNIISFGYILNVDFWYHTLIDGDQPQILYLHIYNKVMLESRNIKELLLEYLI